MPTVKRITWPRLAVAVLAAASTYYLRPVLGYVNLQPLTYFVPVLLVAYLFGSAMGTLAFVFTLMAVHAILWAENPQALFTRPYFTGISTFLMLSAVIVLSSWRREQVLSRLDESLAREKEAREEAEAANRLKDQFLATLSHELRTPINVILGYLQILLDERSRDPRRALEIVHRNAQQQARLIEDVLDVSRLTTGTVQLVPEEVRPGLLLRDAVESLQPALVAKGLRLELGPIDEEAVIVADPHRLRQVFWNLLSNAVKFTPAGGSVSARCTMVDGELEIRVDDTGRGISKDFLPHVFDMFRQGDPSTTRDVSGIGLGLNLVKRFVELQGGTVDVRSGGEGSGASFTCRFPLHEASEAKAVDF
jgi:signal transduction histidine kinase